MFIIKRLNYNAHSADFDRMPKLIIMNNNDKNQLQDFMACQMMGAFDILKRDYAEKKMKRDYAGIKANSN